MSEFERGNKSLKITLGKFYSKSLNNKCIGVETITHNYIEIQIFGTTKTFKTVKRFRNTCSSIFSLSNLKRIIFHTGTFQRVISKAIENVPPPRRNYI